MGKIEEPNQTNGRLIWSFIFSFLILSPQFTTLLNIVIRTSGWCTFNPQSNHASVRHFPPNFFTHTCCFLLNSASFLVVSSPAGMTDSGGGFFTRRTTILGQKLYVLIVATILLVLAIFLVIFLFLRNRSSKRRRVAVKHSSGLLPLVCRESVRQKESDQKQGKNEAFRVESESKKESSESKESSTNRSESSSALSASTDGFGNFGWGRWYSLRELQLATNQFSTENVIGEGGYGVVYRGVLHDGSVVAIKKLLNNK